MSNSNLYFCDLVLTCPLTGGHDLAFKGAAQLGWRLMCWCHVLVWSLRCQFSLESARPQDSPRLSKSLSFTIVPLLMFSQLISLWMFTCYRWISDNPFYKCTIHTWAGFTVYSEGLLYNSDTRTLPHHECQVAKRFPLIDAPGNSIGSYSHLFLSHTLQTMTIRFNACDIY